MENQATAKDLLGGLCPKVKPPKLHAGFHPISNNPAQLSYNISNQGWARLEKLRE